jgi:hypothetical protein
MELSAQQDIGNQLSNQAEAFAGVAFAAIAADREIKDIEVMYLQAIFSRMHLFEGWTVARYTALFQKLQAMLNQQGVTGLLETSVKNLPPRFSQSVFAVSVDVILADGIVRDEEEEFLYRLQELLQIDTPLASQITRVIAIKNQC